MILKLPIEKQNVIIDAALKTFAMHGYKKTSISDIASAAGISKSTVFHYFGTKKELYLYLVNTCVGIISTEVIEKIDDSITYLYNLIIAGLDRNYSRISKLDYFIIQGEIINIIFLQKVDTI